jgi:hypothetical protein
VRFDPTSIEAMGKYKVLGTDQNIRAAKIIAVLSALFLALSIYLKFKS